MKALAGAGAFGLLPHPWTAAIDPCSRYRLQVPPAQQENSGPAAPHRRDVSERMATRDELARLRSELESAGHKPLGGIVQ